MPASDKDVRDILKKYGKKIDERISITSASGTVKTDYSQEYMKFKEEMAPEISKYEKWCKSLGSMIKLKFSEKDTLEARKNLKIAHLDLEPWQPLNLGVMVSIFIFLPYNYFFIICFLFYESLSCKACE